MQHQLLKDVVIHKQWQSAYKHKIYVRNCQSRLCSYNV